MSQKDAQLNIRGDKWLFDEYKEVCDKLNLTASKNIRNHMLFTIENKDVLINHIEKQESEIRAIDLFLEEDYLTNLGNNFNDEVIYHCKNCKNDIKLVKYTRKSNKFQSDFKAGKFGKSLLKCNEILYFAENSSSFYDTAFLRCIEFTKDLECLAIEVLALTRSEYETITRSILIADKVIQKITQYHISLIGLDVMMLRIACVLYQNNQVRRMNTSYSNKTTLFYLYLNYGEQKAKWYYENRKAKGYKKFKQRSFEVYKREYRALYELNNLNKEKFNFALQYLIKSR